MDSQKGHTPSYSIIYSKVTVSIAQRIMHDNFMKKNPYRNTDRTSMKKYHNFMKEKSISKHGENFHKKGINYLM